MTYFHIGAPNGSAYAAAIVTSVKDYPRGEADVMGTSEHDVSYLAFG